MNGRLTISVVATVLNEYGSLPGWIEGLRTQTRLPDECVIVDGGSTDGTLSYLRAVDLPFPLILRQVRGCSIAQGRNAAIDAASGDVIAVTDAGTRAQPDWLGRLVGPLEGSASVDLVAGFFEPEASDLWGRALGAATLPDASEIQPESFLASSRSFALRRAWFEAGFKYPEWLDYCEDVVLDLQLRRAGARQVFEPEAVVRFAPRRSPLAFARQYFRYARGDGKAGLFGKRHAIRYVSYGLAALAISRRRPRELAIAFTLGLLYMRAPITRYRRRTAGTPDRQGEFARAVALMAFQRGLGDVAKIAGYPVGMFWRVSRGGSLKLWKTGWASRASGGSPRRL